ncbi:hypothetical protein SARI_03070 [Salmonella enterica subsp. arizonae serovar 62:z4,z23:-]|uniref:Uncharacterized protein n=1 Tax=Salmonella arizonae (strain ATCC BAA-731 / CDC346-86 / RSK2980) TaxID=41514 RepID=A9MS08_SALAR|nr:hypothetical protein SARI_03070 [Salmonella enterica subsp. arizonae serovar 62:z4,z23:-]
MACALDMSVNPINFMQNNRCPAIADRQTGGVAGSGNTWDENTVFFIIMRSGYKGDRLDSRRSRYVRCFVPVNVQAHLVVFFVVDKLFIGKPIMIFIFRRRG